MLFKDVYGQDAVKQLLADNRKDALMALVAEDLALATEADNIAQVLKFLYIFRDFYRLLRNFAMKGLSMLTKPHWSIRWCRRAIITF